MSKEEIKDGDPVEENDEAGAATGTENLEVAETNSEEEKTEEEGT